ncbi:MAG: hypothetical protein ACOCG5_00260 [Candidatus Alkaliphilus sp. MAG34]
MRNIIIRTFGGKDTGYGHYYRCLSLAKAIKLTAKNVHIIFLVNKELHSLIQTTGFNFIISNDLNDDLRIIENLDVVLFIFDSYLGNDGYLRHIKNSTRLMLIDDNNDIYDSSIPNIIYNGNIHAEGLGYKYIKEQTRLLGPEYLIMKEEYWGNKIPLFSKDGVLITTGGTDEYGIVLNIMNGIKGLDINVRIIIGPGYRNNYIKEIKKNKTQNMELIHKPSSLKEYIDSSKIVITAGGSTVYEVISQRSIPVIFSIADNQDLMCGALQEMGVEYLGKYPNIDYSKLRGLLEKLEQDGTFDEKIFDITNNEGAKIVANTIIEQIL